MSTEKRISIGGMSCGHCVSSVRKALEKCREVEVVDVEIGSATVVVGDDAVNDLTLKEAIEDIGFDVLKIE